MDGIQVINEASRSTKFTMTLTDVIVISRNPKLVMAQGSGSHNIFTDLELIYCKLNCRIQSITLDFLTYRDLENFKHSAFSNDL